MLIKVWFKIASFLRGPVTRRYHSKQYEDYLKSKEWASKRKEAFKHYGRRCAKCGTNERLQVHHRSYYNLGHEPMRDLQILCFWCHKKEDEDRRRQQGLPVKAKKWR